MYTLLSIDALTEQDLLEFSKCKYLGPIISRSFIVPKIVAVYPTQTYTCHASMVTGCYPDRHSIINNTVAFGSDWHWMRRDINVPILTDYLKKEGFVTASCAFPCLGGSDIDYLIPEIWTESSDMDSDLAFASKPCPTSEKALPYYYKNKGLLDWMRTPGFDLFATSCFIDIVRENKVDFAMLHLSYLDHQKHKHGKAPKEAYEFIDAKVGQIVEMLDKEGIDNRFIILGDHGHRPIRKVFNLAKALEEEGAKDIIKVHCACQMAMVYTSGASKARATTLMETLKKKYPQAIERVLDAKETKNRYHLSGDFAFTVEACDGYMFETQGGPLEREADSYNVSGHGYAPEKGPFSPFVVENLVHSPVAEMNLVDVAPTVLGLMGIKAKDMDGKNVL